MHTPINYARDPQYQCTQYDEAMLGACGFHTNAQQAQHYDKHGKFIWTAKYAPSRFRFRLLFQFALTRTVRIRSRAEAFQSYIQNDGARIMQCGKQAQGIVWKFSESQVYFDEIETRAVEREEQEKRLDMYQ